MDDKKLPEVGKRYRSIRRETVAHVLEVNNDIVKYRTYEEETQCSVTLFWNLFRKEIHES